jgi:hypothetical protein
MAAVGAPSLKIWSKWKWVLDRRDCMVTKPNSYAEYGLKVRITKLRAKTTNYVKKMQRLSEGATSETMKQQYLRRAKYAAFIEAGTEKELRARLDAIKNANVERRRQ